MNTFLKTILNKPARIALLTIAILFAFTRNASAQDSKGTEFWICFPGNYSAVQPQLYITGEQASTVTIEIPGLSYSQVVDVAAGGLQVVTLPNAAQVESQFTAEKKGIHITATEAVTVYGMNAQTATTDAYLAFPVDAIGKEYYVLGYNKDFSNQIPTQATITASENNTTVTITSSLTDGGFTTGVPSNITLQKGDVYQLRSVITNADYSGTKITSDKPISVFGGAQCTNISGNLRACDHLVEQLPPLNSWGKSFVTVPLATRLNGDVFRFLAQKNGTAVSVNGSVVATLDAGKFFETILSSTSYNVITSTQPILVGQYSRSSEADGITSDPFFALVPPDEQFLNFYVVSSGTSNIPNNYANITAKTSNIGAVMVDGSVVSSGLWNVIPGTSFSGAKVSLSTGVHTISSSLPIGVLVYGFGSYDSYGYLGGQSFSPVADVTTLKLSLNPSTGTAPVGTELCFNALVKDQFNHPVSGVRVDFNITGVNSSSTGFANTNSSGVAHFCYTGVNPGQDNIVASVGTVNDAASFIWTSTPPPPSGDCPADQHIVLSSCSDKTTLTWRVPRDTFPDTINIVNYPGPGKGILVFQGLFKGHAYYKSAQGTTLWLAGIDLAKFLTGKGVVGHLVTLNSSAENNYVKNIISSADYSYQIGLFNYKTPGNFLWITGEPLNYMNWATGQPDNHGGTATNIKERYVVMRNNGTWNDTIISRLPFVAEFEKPLIVFKKIKGPAYGSMQGVGEYTICYERTNLITMKKDTCCFTISVTCNTSLQNRRMNPGITSASPQGLKVTTYPNPSHDYFALNIAGSNKQEISISITDQLGRVVEARSGVAPNQNLKIGSSLKPGFYIIQVTQGASKVVSKLIKE